MKHKNSVLIKRVLFIHVFSLGIIVIQICLSNYLGLSLKGYWIDKVAFWVYILSGTFLSLIVSLTITIRLVSYYFKMFFFLPILIVLISLFSPFIGILFNQLFAICFGSHETIIFEDRDYRLQTLSFGFSAPKIVVFKKNILLEEELGYGIYPLNTSEISQINIEKKEEEKILRILYKNSNASDTLIIYSFH